MRKGSTLIYIATTEYPETLFLAQLFRYRTLELGDESTRSPNMPTQVASSNPNLARSLLFCLQPLQVTQQFLQWYLWSESCRYVWYFMNHRRTSGRTSLSTWSPRLPDYQIFLPMFFFRSADHEISSLRNKEWHTAISCWCPWSLLFSSREQLLPFIGTRTNIIFNDPLAVLKSEFIQSRLKSHVGRKVVSQAPKER